MVEAMDTLQAVCARTLHSIRTLLAAALVTVLLGGAVVAAGPILLTPDRRAIPQLVTREQTEIRYGTGVVVGAETILTARHAVAGTVEVVLPNAKVIGGVRCRAPDRDTAVITAKLPPGTPRYRISFRTLKVGETVRVGGYPDRRWMVVSGRVTHMIKSAILSDRRVTTPMVVFKPALHQGASGSPVLDARGFVVGIFVASNAQEDYSIALPIATGLGPCRSIVQESAAPVVPVSSFRLPVSDVRIAHS
jgi:S1-C subfamily serine protease